MGSFELALSYLKNLRYTLEKCGKACFTGRQINFVILNSITSGEICMAYLKSVELQIKEAMVKGKFNNLPGKGKPIDLAGYFKTPAHLRMAFKILKDAGYVPAELQLKKEIEDLKGKRRAIQDDEVKSSLDREINKKTMLYNMVLEQIRTEA